MILALSTGHQLGLLLVAGLFIAFALASSFLFPRSNPDFPGTARLRLFVAVCAAFVVAMMTAMVVLAGEGEEGEHGAEAAQTEGASTGGEPAEPAPTESEPAAAEGDPEAGKEIFSSAGCVACHTLADAGSTGTVGPNLDEAKPDHDLVVERVTNGMGPMPSFKDSLGEDDIQNVAAYVVHATSGS